VDFDHQGVEVLFKFCVKWHFSSLRFGIDLGLPPDRADWPHPQDVAPGFHRERLEVIIALGLPSCLSLHAGFIHNRPESPPLAPRKYLYQYPSTPGAKQSPPRCLPSRNEVRG
jgi:hypothetical protein